MINQFTSYLCLSNYGIKVTDAIHIDVSLCTKNQRINERDRNGNLFVNKGHEALTQIKIIVFS